MTRLLLSLALLAVTASATAQERAWTLYAEAQALSEDGRHDAALALFRQVQRLATEPELRQASCYALAVTADALLEADSTKGDLACEAVGWFDCFLQGPTAATGAPLERSRTGRTRMTASCEAATAKPPQAVLGDPGEPEPEPGPGHPVPRASDAPQVTQPEPVQVAEPPALSEPELEGEGPVLVEQGNPRLARWLLAGGWLVGSAAGAGAMAVAYGQAREVRERAEAGGEAASESEKRVARLWLGTAGALLAAGAAFGVGGVWSWRASRAADVRVRAGLSPGALQLGVRW